MPITEWKCVYKTEDLREINKGKMNKSNGLRDQTTNMKLFIYIPRVVSIKETGI